MWLHFRSFPESQIHFARADKSGSFRIHSWGLQIKSQIGCSFCLCCVFICQEQLSSLSSASACHCQSPPPSTHLVTSLAWCTSNRGMCPLMGLKSSWLFKQRGRCDWGPQWGGSPSWVLSGTCHFWPRFLPKALPLGACARLLEGLSGEDWEFSIKAQLPWGQSESPMCRNSQLQPLEERWEGRQQTDMMQRAQKSKGFGVSHLVLVPVETFTYCVTLGQLLYLSEFQFQLQQSYQHAPHRNVYFKAHKKHRKEHHVGPKVPFRSGLGVSVSWGREPERWVLQDHGVGGALALSLPSPTAVWGRGLETALGYFFVSSFVPLRPRTLRPTGISSFGLRFIPSLL